MQEHERRPMNRLSSPYLSALALRESGDFTQAIVILRTWLADNQFDAEAHAHLCHILLLDEQIEAAATALGDALAIEPSLPIVQRNLARLLVKQGKANEALQAAKSAHQIDGSNWENQLVLAAVLATNKLYGEALDLIEKVIAAEPPSAEAHLLRAQLKSIENQIDGAIADAEVAVSLKPHMVQAWALIGANHFKNGNVLDAMHAAKMFLKYKPNNAAQLALLGELKRRAGDFDAAVETLKLALKFDPLDAATWSNLGASLQRLERIEDAKQAYQKAIELNPRQVATLINLGSLITLTDEPQEELLQYLQQAIELQPNNVGAHNNLGMALVRLERTAEAKQAFLKALEHNPDYVEALCNLGRLLNAIDEPQEGLRYLHRAIKLQPDRTEPQTLCGLALAKLGRYAEALNHFNSALTLDRKSYHAYVHRASTLFKLAKYREAILSCNEAIGIDSKKKEAREVLLEVFHAQCDAVGLEKELAKYIATFNFVHDAEFDRLYVRGLIKTGTGPIPVRRRNRFRSLLELFSRCQSLEGLVAECGCYKGLSSFLLCTEEHKGNQEFDGTGYQIYDSFQGLSDTDEQDFATEDEQHEHHPDEDIVKKGNFAATLTEVKESLCDFPGIEYFPGWIPDAFPKTDDNRYRFVHVDVDLYQPTKEVLQTSLWVGSTLLRTVCKGSALWTAWSCTDSCLG
jgi:tetratricopeptide (TPR) repeat protein